MIEHTANDTVRRWLQLHGFFAWGQDAWIHEDDEGHVMSTADAIDLSIARDLAHKADLAAKATLPTLTYEMVLDALCNCELNYPYASEDCPHKGQARRIYARLSEGLKSDDVR